MGHGCPGRAGDRRGGAGHRRAGPAAGPLAGLGCGLVRRRGGGPLAYREIVEGRGIGAKALHAAARRRGPVRRVRHAVHPRRDPPGLVREGGADGGRPRLGAPEPGARPGRDGEPAGVRAAGRPGEPVPGPGRLVDGRRPGGARGPRGLCGPRRRLAGSRPLARAPPPGRARRSSALSDRHAPPGDDPGRPGGGHRGGRAGPGRHGPGGVDAQLGRHGVGQSRRSRRRQRRRQRGQGLREAAEHRVHRHRRLPRQRPPRPLRRLQRHVRRADQAQTARPNGRPGQRERPRAARATGRESPGRPPVLGRPHGGGSPGASADRPRGEGPALRQGADAGPPRPGGLRPVRRAGVGGGTAARGRLFAGDGVADAPLVPTRFARLLHSRRDRRPPDQGRDARLGPRCRCRPTWPASGSARSTAATSSAGRTTGWSGWSAGPSPRAR